MIHTLSKNDMAPSAICLVAPITRFEKLRYDVEGEALLWCT
jgi:hypothetical protein